MAISKEDILEAVSSMSVLDLSELIKEMEENLVFQQLQLQLLHLPQLVVVAKQQLKKKVNLIFT